MHYLASFGLLAISILVLMEVISVHRVTPGKDPYWSGPLYQVNRNDLSYQFGCVVDDVSSALQWLRQVGLVEVVHRTHIDGIGKPCGTKFLPRHAWIESS